MSLIDRSNYSEDDNENLDTFSLEERKRALDSIFGNEEAGNGSFYKEVLYPEDLEYHVKFNLRYLHDSLEKLSFAELVKFTMGYIIQSTVKEKVLKQLWRQDLLG